MRLSNSLRDLVNFSFGVILLFICGAFRAEAASNDPLVLYTFDEVGGSVVPDVSGTGIPMDLVIRDPEYTRWLPGGGLAVDQPTLIMTNGPANKITGAIKASNALTIEAWIQPDSTMQSGPARIATLADDTGLFRYNFTLAQAATAYAVRLRSTKTDNDGKMPTLRSSESSLDINLTHVVYTRDSDGIARLYINGVRQSRKIVGRDLSNWEDSYKFALANELSGDRPWTGNFYQVAIYDRVLSVSEIDTSFVAGADGTSSSSADQSNYKSTDGTSSYKIAVTTGADGKHSASLSSLSPPASDTKPITGSISLDWIAPVTRSDGNALAMNEIAGYSIYFLSPVTDNLNLIAINDAYATSITITDMPVGTYYFVITTRDIDGRESGYSNMAVKLVQ